MIRGPERTLTSAEALGQWMDLYLIHVSERGHCVEEA